MCPLEWYLCPDKETISVLGCLNKCRMRERCLTLPTLTLMSKEREGVIWVRTGSDEPEPIYTPSTTELLNGTMYSFLKLTKLYSVDPDSRAFMLSGTRHHKILEDIAEELGLPAEIPLNVDRDIFDLLETEEGNLVLTDYKLWGSYRVAKALGITQIGKQPDPSGAVYKTTSKYGKAGEPKMIPVFMQVEANADNKEVELQLNRYRIMLEELGIHIYRMQIQVTVRDGGLAVAFSRGIMRNTYRIPVKKLDDQAVEDYFEMKSYNLLEALKHGWSEPCSPEECWDNRRCEEYCDVWSWCLRGQLIHSLDNAKKEE